MAVLFGAGAKMANDHDATYIVRDDGDAGAARGHRRRCAACPRGGWNGPDARDAGGSERFCRASGRADSREGAGGGGREAVRREVARAGRLAGERLRHRARLRERPAALWQAGSGAGAHRRCRGVWPGNRHQQPRTAHPVDRRRGRARGAVRSRQAAPQPGVPKGKRAAPRASQPDLRACLPDPRAPARVPCECELLRRLVSGAVRPVHS